MPGPRHLVDWPWVTVEIECPLCRRHGRYRLARLAERHGAEIALGALLRAIAARCGLPGQEVDPRPYEARCGARFRVPPGGPLPDDAPAREARPGEVWPPRTRRLGLQGPLPTIGAALADGQRGVLVYCIGRLRDGYPCHHQGRVDLAAIPLPPEVPLIRISQARLLRCSRCGSRDVEVRCDWPNPTEVRAREINSGEQPVAKVNGILVPRFGDAIALPRRGGETVPRATGS